MSTKVDELSFEGPLGIEQAGDIQKALKATLSKAKAVRLDLSKVSTLDLSVIQVIVSAKKAAKERGIEFDIAERMTPEVIRSFWLSGLVSRVDKGDVNKTVDAQLQGNI